VRLSHHELCFGCGQQNLFGLALELEPADDGGLTGRFFVKQDHQGLDGSAHAGIIGTALEEAMTLVVDASDPGAARAPADGSRARTTRLEIDYRAPAPVGTFVEVRAWLEGPQDGQVVVRAVAFTAEDEAPVAEARAILSDARVLGEQPVLE
jgi:acyl-coenzyme A thioesterase PaaI-like protein